MKPTVRSPNIGQRLPLQGKRTGGFRGLPLAPLPVGTTDSSSICWPLLSLGLGLELGSQSEELSPRSQPDGGQRKTSLTLLSYPVGMSQERQEVLGNCRNRETFTGRRDQRAYFLAKGTPRMKTGRPEIHSLLLRLMSKSLDIAGQ